MARFSRKTQRSLLRGEAGANMVEFAVALPVFMMFVVVIVDLGRVTSLGNVIREAMAMGIKTATSVANLDVDPRGLSKDDYGYRRSKIAREMVEDSTLRLLAGIGGVSTKKDVDVAAADVAKLYDIVITENRLSDGPDTETYKIVVLLPGECATVPALGLTDCNRKTLGTDEADPFPAQPPKFLIRKHPVKLLAYAHFDSFTPWLFKSYQKFEQYAYRQPIPEGPFPADIDPQPWSEIKAEMTPEDHKPKGKAQMPKEKEKKCIPDWNYCIWKSIQMKNDPRWRKQVPAYWKPSNRPDGICDCRPIDEQPR